MYKYLLDNLRSHISILLLSITSVLVLFILESHAGFSLLDEGYLWYGAQRVMAGEVPLRDFASYDIGRYYWSAAIMSLLGSNGIVALRVAIAVFQGTSFFIGLTILSRNSVKQPLFWWMLVSITILAWMAPQFRLFDISLPILLAGVLSLLIERPSVHRYFLTGLTVGLAAIFGRNHGVYGVLGSLSVMTYLTLQRKNISKLAISFPSWVLGVVVGYLPMLIFFVFDHDFAQAFWESIRLILDAKATNLPLPVPWPWLVPFGKLPLAATLQRVILGIFFIAIVIFGVFGMVWLFRRKLQTSLIPPSLIAAIFLALPYTHLAYSRADIEHLAPSIQPFLIGSFALLACQPHKIKWAFATLLCCASLLVMLPMHSGWYCYSTQQCVETKVGEDQLKVDFRMSRNLVLLTKLAEQYAPNGRAFIVAPSWPGAYAALGRKSPMWGIYFALSPSSMTLQQAEIERIRAANPGFVVIYDAPIDGRDDLRFKNTNPVVDQYIRDNFEPLAEYTQPSFQTYKSK